MSRFGYDDDPGGFDRPRRRTRPRTKDRPTYDDALPGFVVRVDRGRYATRILDGEPRTVAAVKARPLGRKAVVVGDDVRVVGDVSGDDGALARIVEVAERRTSLRRTADDNDPVERVIVANADQMVIVTAVENPEPRPRLIDRCVVAAFDARMDALLCLTKTDLASPDELVGIYRPLGVRHVVTRRDRDPGELRDVLVDRVSVFVGPSGVGKSTLINNLVPGADRAVGIVNDATGRGRHTSSYALGLELPGGGWVVDTPGIRSFGLAHVRLAHLLEAFPDLYDITAGCPRGCTHRVGETECALDDALAEGTVEPARVESFRRLIESREAQSDY
jgi:ribosome biogenesis GTPase / thiamine phosphate phosphatase